MDICVVQNKDGHLEVLSTASDGALWHILQQTPGGSFGGWHSLGTPQGAALYSDPYVIANADGRLEVFAKGNPSDSTNFVGTAIWHTWQVTPGGEWGS